MAKKRVTKSRWSFYAEPDLAKRIQAFREASGDYSDAAICRVLIELGLSKTEKIERTLLRTSMNEGAIAGWAHIREVIMRAIQQRDELLKEA